MDKIIQMGSHSRKLVLIYPLKFIIKTYLHVIHCKCSNEGIIKKFICNTYICLLGGIKLKLIVFKIYYINIFASLLINSSCLTQFLPNIIK